MPYKKTQDLTGVIRVRLIKPCPPPSCSPSRQSVIAQTRTRTLVEVTDDSLKRQDFPLLIPMRGPSSRFVEGVEVLFDLTHDAGLTAMRVRLVNEK